MVQKRGAPGPGPAGPHQGLGMPARGCPAPCARLGSPEPPADPTRQWLGARLAPASGPSQVPPRFLIRAAVPPQHSSPHLPPALRLPKRAVSAFSPAACRCFSVPPHPDVSLGTFEGPQTHSRCSTLASAGTFTPVPYPGWVSGGTPRHGVPRNPCSHCFSPRPKSRRGALSPPYLPLCRHLLQPPPSPAGLATFPLGPWLGGSPFPKESRSLQTPPCLPPAPHRRKRKCLDFSSPGETNTKQPEEAGGLQSGDCKVLTGEGAAACCRLKVLELCLSAAMPQGRCLRSSADYMGDLPRQRSGLL